jgi:hypothetical protein
MVPCCESVYVCARGTLACPSFFISGSGHLLVWCAAVMAAPKCQSAGLHLELLRCATRLGRRTSFPHLNFNAIYISYLSVEFEFLNCMRPGVPGSDFRKWVLESIQPRAGCFRYRKRSRLQRQASAEVQTHSSHVKKRIDCSRVRSSCVACHSFGGLEDKISTSCMSASLVK